MKSRTKPKSLVRPKPFAKKKKPFSVKKTLQKTARKTGISLPEISLNIPSPVKKFISGTLIALILIWFSFFFLIKWVFFQEKFMIESVKFSQTSIDTFEDIELYNLIYHTLKGRNYYVLTRFQKDAVIADIHSQFPFIQDLDFQLELKSTWDLPDLDVQFYQPSGLSAVLQWQLSADDFLQTLDKKADIYSGLIEDWKVVSENWGIIGVDIKFSEPDFLVHLGNEIFWVWWDNATRKLDSNKALGMWKFVVDTPQYASWAKSLSWFFFEIPFSVFQQVIPMLQEQFPDMTRFVYLAGSPRCIVFLWDQAFYLNLISSEGMILQFEKYDNLKKYYSWFDEIEVADLSALDADKVIVRKKF